MMVVRKEAEIPLTNRRDDRVSPRWEVEPPPLVLPVTSGHLELEFVVLNFEDPSTGKRLDVRLGSQSRLSNADRERSRAAWSCAVLGLAIGGASHPLTVCGYDSRDAGHVQRSPLAQRCAAFAPVLTEHKRQRGCIDDLATEARHAGAGARLRIVCHRRGPRRGQRAAQPTASGVAVRRVHVPDWFRCASDTAGGQVQRRRTDARVGRYATLSGLRRTRDGSQVPASRLCA
jgi:hypothetical protein